MSDFEKLVLADTEEDRIILVDGAEEEKDEKVVIESPEENADIVIVEEEKAETKPESSPEKPARSSKAQERIATLVRKLREAERDRDKLNSLLQTQQKVVEEQYAAQKNSTEEQIKLTKARMQKAFDDGNAEELVEAQSTLIKLQAPVLPPVSSTTPEPYQPPSAERDWLVRTGFESWPAPSQIIAVNLYKQLCGTYDVNDAELYSEIDRRLKQQQHYKELYELFGMESGEESEEEKPLTVAPKTPRITKPSVGTPRTGGPVSTLKDGKVILTEEDKRTMRLFDFDPSNPAHVKSFLKHGKGMNING